MSSPPLSTEDLLKGFIAKYHIRPAVSIKFNKKPRKITEIVVQFGDKNNISEILNTTVMLAISMWYAHNIRFVVVPQKYYLQNAVTVCDATYDQWVLFRLLGAQNGDTLLITNPAKLLVLCSP